MTADQPTAIKPGFSRSFLVLVLAAPVVWAVMYWLFAVPLSDRLADSGTSIIATFGLNDPLFLRTLLFAGLIYPVLEEIVFRGALQGFLLDRLPSSLAVERNQSDERGVAADADTATDSETSGLTSASTATPRYRMLVGGVSWANVLTSLAFAALHLISQPPLWAFLVFFPSLAFGWLREASGGLIFPIILHIFYNLGFFLLFH